MRTKKTTSAPLMGQTEATKAMPNRPIPGPAASVETGYDYNFRIALAELAPLIQGRAYDPETPPWILLDQIEQRSAMIRAKYLPTVKG